MKKWAQSFFSFSVFIFLASSSFADDIDSALSKTVGTPLRISVFTTFLNQDGASFGFLSYMEEVGILQKAVSQPPEFAKERAEVFRLEELCAKEAIADAQTCFSFGSSKNMGRPNGSKNWNTFETAFFAEGDVKYIFMPDERDNRKSMMSFGYISEMRAFDGEMATPADCDDSADVRIWFDTPSLIASALMEYVKRDHIMARACFEVAREGLKLKRIDVALEP